jgi:hypothetical protein
VSASADTPRADAGPLNGAELAELHATQLPALELHRLRLLAHGLRTLQQIAGLRAGPAPSTNAIALWAAKQPAIAADRVFQTNFTAQLRQLADQLGAIGAARGIQALDLDLSDLCAWALAETAPAEKAQAETTQRLDCGFSD